MNNLIRQVRSDDLPANCEEARLHFKTGAVRNGYLVRTKKVTAYHFFICNKKLYRNACADIEMIPRDLVAFIDPSLK